MRSVRSLLPPGLIIVVGMRAEAQLLPAGFRVFCAGGDPERLATSLQGAKGDCVLSFGIAGGLRPGLDCATLTVATQVVEGRASWPTDPDWTARLAAATGAMPIRLAASRVVISSSAAKASLHAASGAAAVDMESGVAAEFAQARGIPFAALRAIADPWSDALPPAAAVGLHPDGRPAPGRVLAALLRRPQDLPGLLRIAGQTRRALMALRLAVARARA